MNLSDTDQAPYSAPAPQTATVSDEAVQAALDKWHGLPLSTEDAMRAALTAALPHLSQIVTKPVDVAAVREQALDEAAAYHDNEAEYYEARNGDKDGVPFPIVAGWHRLDAQRIRALSPAELVTVSSPTMEGDAK